MVEPVELLQGGQLHGFPGLPVDVLQRARCPCVLCGGAYRHATAYPLQPHCTYQSFDRAARHPNLGRNPTQWLPTARGSRLDAPAPCARRARLLGAAHRWAQRFISKA